MARSDCYLNIKINIIFFKYVTNFIFYLHSCPSLYGWWTTVNHGQLYTSPNPKVRPARPLAKHRQEGARKTRRIILSALRPTLIFHFYTFPKFTPTAVLPNVCWWRVGLSTSTVSSGYFSLFDGRSRTRNGYIRTRQLVFALKRISLCLSLSLCKLSLLLIFQEN